MSELLEQVEMSQSSPEPPPVIRAGQQLVSKESKSGAARFGAALTELALTVHNGADPLTVITQGAIDIVPGAELAALVILTGPSRLEACAVTGPLPPQIIALQNEVGEGPCLDAVKQLGVVWVANLATETRWPQFAAGAIPLGVGSMMCTPLMIQDRIYGSLSLASATPDAFDEESQAMAAVFAANITLALAGDEWRRNMTAALSSRDVIGQAKGILMERYRVTPDAAFALLVKASQHTHTKLRDVSDQLCRTGVLPTA
ncbi:MAG TPA: GAF and ANTAR domain-containing protein [Jatrophihabitans sp.]|jgi:transcriptional regulator with GAF, ATPase, and Fis domain|uniref:GAF and ANTAR domain-containing protein n=1 Tax=Jatrophihabitans sp. TaxID=1932789 RepID=UPI002F09FAF4